MTEEKLIEKYGAPLYVYDGEKIKSQYEKLKQAFDCQGIKIHYAMKALSNISVLKFMKSLGCGIDAVSVNEVKLALLAGFCAEDIIFTPNGISEQELGEAVKLGVKVNVDSYAALEFIAKNFPEKPVGIRINPHILAGGNIKISTGHIDSKFGVSYLLLDKVLELVKKYNLKINGLHMHTGSDIYDIDVFLQGADVLFSIAENFKDLEYIDFGSGFKVKYKNDDLSTDIEFLGKKLCEKFKEFKERQHKTYNLIFEPGKFLVSEAGTFLVKVNAIKQSPTSSFAQVDSGFCHLIRPMFYDSYHKIENLSNPKGEEKIYNVTGFICETDSFATKRLIPEIKKDDILVFRNAGAYGFSMSSNYNSRLKPAEVFLYQGKDFLIRKRETFDDLLSNQIVIDF